MKVNQLLSEHLIIILYRKTTGQHKGRGYKPFQMHIVHVHCAAWNYTFSITMEWYNINKSLTTASSLLTYLACKTRDKHPLVPPDINTFKRLKYEYFKKCFLSSTETKIGNFVHGNLQCCSTPVCILTPQSQRVLSSRDGKPAHSTLKMLTYLDPGQQNAE